MIYPPLWSDEVEQRIRKEARNLDPQVPPENPQTCTRCVMTSARPRIVFDEEGVCSACRHAERKASGIDWGQRRKELEALLDAHRGRGPYDCVVPCSGGKDSSFVAWTLKHEYGMNPLCARWQPHMITDIGQRNWDAFIHSGFDAVTAQPNGLLHRKLSRIALEYYGDPFLPFIYGQLAWPMHVAKQNGIKLVFFGENGEAEYGGDPSANDKPCWDEAHWERVYMKGGSFARLLLRGQQAGAVTPAEAMRSCQFYVPPTRSGEEFHWLGYYLPWHPMGNFYLAAENTGFEPNEDRSEGTFGRYASLDDCLDGYHFWWGWLKFGIGRAVSDAAQQVRNGELTRDEALALVAKFDGEFPRKYHQECLSYLGLDEDHFRCIAERFNRSGVDWRAKMDAD